jgi:hypothetical protein
MGSALGLLILVVCSAFLIFSFRRALLRRRDFARVRRGPLYGANGAKKSAHSRRSAEDIADGGQVAAQELLDSLSVRDAPELDSEGEDDGVSGLGLSLHRGSATSQLPQVMEGTRSGRQVFIRQGLVGDSVSPGLGLRRSRTITVVRVDAPAFEARLEHGRIEPDEDAPASARDFLATLASSPDVWHDGRLVSGAEGIAVSRAAADDWLGGWIYDLWLLERLVHDLHAETLPPVALSRTWEAPYGLHSWAPGLLDRR